MNSPLTSAECNAVKETIRAQISEIKATTTPATMGELEGKSERLRVLRTALRKMELWIGAELTESSVSRHR